MLAPATSAPAFTLVDHHGVSRSLDDYRGRWLVLWWFPRACSEVCSIQGRHLGTIAPQLSELDVAIVGVSFDPSEDNARFADQEALDFPLLSDVDRVVGTAYDVVRAPDEPFADAPRRVSYVIDPAGVVRKSYEVADVVEHAQVLVADLQTLTAATTLETDANRAAR